MPRILLVDDSAAILSNLSEYLELKGWESESASCAFDAERLMHKGAFDAVVLDIGLPDKDGLTLCSEWRARGVSTPILFLTARDTVDERVEGLETGGDDYLSKPFALKELFARLQVLLRRAGAAGPSVLRVGDLELDCSQLVVKRAGRTLKLNPIGFAILQELMRRSPGIVPRERLLTVGWGSGIPTSDSLRTNFYLLRKTVDAPGLTPLIQTHPGFGWSCAPANETH